MTVLSPYPAPTLTILHSLCRDLADQCGLPWAGVRLNPKGSELVEHLTEAPGSWGMEPDVIAIVARAPMPANDGTQWGEVVLGDFFDQDPSDGSRSRLRAFGASLGRLFDRAEASGRMKSFGTKEA